MGRGYADMTGHVDWHPISIGEAIALGWQDADDGTGTVTRVWDEWFFTDQDQRAWVTQTLTWANQRYDDEWERIRHEPGDPDGPEPFDLLTRRMGGLMQPEFQWLTLSSLDVDVRPNGVAEIVQLRNVLTHSRGELRTPGDRARFAKDTGMWGHRLAHLDLATVTQCLNELGQATRLVDPVAWAYSYARQRIPMLLK